MPKPISNFKGWEFPNWLFQSGFSLPSRNKEYIFRSIRGTLQLDSTGSEHKICLLSMPHLSRFKVDARGDETNNAYDARTAIDWMNEEKNRYMS